MLLAGLGYGYAVPVWDSDFWWHLASGRWIWQSGFLPEHDPFGVFGDANPIRSATVLKGQWLGQVLFYAMHQLGGINAIVGLRVALLVGSLLLLYHRLRLARIGPVSTLGTIALVGICLQAYTGDRPQLLSIFFTALTFWIVDRTLRSSTPRLLIALPLIAVAWGNAHGGVVLGCVLLVTYATVQWWHSRATPGQDLRAVRMLLVAAGIFTLATWYTPNGLEAYAYIANLQGSELQARTSEYISALRLYTQGLFALQGWIGLALLLAIASLPGLWRRAPEKAVLVALLAALSIESFRYFMFLLVAAAPWVAEGLRPIATLLSVRVTAKGSAWAAASIVAAALLLQTASQWGVPRGGIDAQRYPMALAPAAGALSGRGFNYMNWGGYLLWHAPTLTPYIDGRMLDDAQLMPYTHMLWASPQGRLWYEQAGFDWVLIPYFDQQGEIYGLNHYLASHPLWQLQAQYGNERLYVRRDGAQRGWQIGQ